MISEDIEALALADAVGALDGDEQRQLQALIAALSPEEQAHVARCYDLALSLGASAPQAEPPAHGRHRLLAAIRAVAPAPLPTPAPTPAPAPVTLPNYTLLERDGWSDSPLPGIRVKVLAIDTSRNMVTMLFRAEPGARYPSHRHSTGEECYVLSGSVVIEGRVLRAGDFHHAEAGTNHAEIYTVEGAEVLLVGAIADYLPDHA
jgi:quercetin dioxygenase-like cupin family protein